MSDKGSAGYIRDRSLRKAYHGLRLCPQGLLELEQGPFLHTVCERKGCQSKRRLNRRCLTCQGVSRESNTYPRGYLDSDQQACRQQAVHLQGHTCDQSRHYPPTREHPCAVSGRAVSGRAVPVPCTDVQTSTAAPSSNKRPNDQQQKNLEMGADETHWRN